MSETPKKITIIIPDLRGGGAEIVAINLANEFFLRGYKVDVVVMFDVGAFQNKLNPNITIYSLNANRMRNVIVPLIKYLRLHRPDAVLANMWPLTMISVWAKIIARIKCRLVLVEHTTWSEAQLADKLFNRIKISLSMALSFPFADAVVTVSNGATQNLSGFAHLKLENIQTIYNPVIPCDQTEYQPPNEQLAWLDGPHIKILAVGNLKQIKGFDCLLKSFLVLRKSVNARLLILGEGEERHSLERLIRKLGLVGSVSLPGFEPNPSAYYAKADLFVLSSQAEGFGNVIVEAMAHGNRIVSTDCPSGPREILDDGKYGILTKVGDADLLANAMIDSLSTSHDKYSVILRAQEFTVVKAADKYLKLLFPAEQGSRNE